MLDTFYGYFTPGSVEKKVVGGIPDEVAASLEARGVLLKRPNTYGAGAGLTYDPEVLKVVWDELVSLSGARVLFHAYFADVLMDGARVSGVIVGTKRGLRAIHARVIVDASGDADVVARAGAPFEDAGVLGIAQSLTTTFKVINVDVPRATAFPKKELWVRMASASGYDLPRKEGSAHITPLHGVMVTNMTPGRGCGCHRSRRAFLRGDGGTPTSTRVHALPARSNPRVRTRGTRGILRGHRGA
ncbi:MAG: FAD-dependent oxidoreductase [Pleurocapsa sp. SU_196_0]|nr:FAD-dependent oxidoreductase [Pleurocapsa sp. SU_196_0]